MKLILRIILFTFICSQQSFGETLIIKGDMWCPFNCSPTEKNKGYMVDIIKTIFEKKGHNIDYQIDTWTNSISDVRSGKANAIIAANVYDAPDFIFPKNSLGFSKDCFFVKHDDKWEFVKEDSLAKRKLGIVESYAYSRSMNEFIKNNPQNIFRANGDNALEALHLEMISGKINTIVENPIVFNYYMEHNLKETKYEEAGCSEGTDLYLAFSPKNPRSKEFAKILSEGIDQLRKDGTLDKIISKYKIKEWR